MAIRTELGLPQSKASSSVRLDDDLVEALKNENIYEVLRKLPNKVKAADIEKFLANQHSALKEGIFQVDKIMSGPGEMPDYTGLKAFSHLVDDPKNILTPEEVAIFEKAMGQMLGGRQNKESAQKKMYVKAAEATELGEQADVEDLDTDIFSIAEEALDEFDTFFSDLESRMFEAQVMADMKKKDKELRGELQKLYEMAKRGEIDPEYVVMAILKVRQNEQGHMFVLEGKKLMKLNEDINRITKEISKHDPGSMEYMQQTQAAQAEIRNIGMTQQQVQFRLQEISQNLTSLVEWGAGFVRSYKRDQSSIVSNIRSAG